MKVKELIAKLQEGNCLDYDIVLGSDEELNTIYTDIEIGTLGKKKLVMWGNTTEEE